MEDDIVHIYEHIKEVHGYYVELRTNRDLFCSSHFFKIFLVFL